MAASLRTAASRAARALGSRAAQPQQQQGPLAVAVRCMSGEYNPFTHALDRLNTKKVRSHHAACVRVLAVGVVSNQFGPVESDRWVGAAVESIARPSNQGTHYYQINRRCDAHANP